METIVLKDTSIATQIYFVRGAKIMIDFDLALLYGVETKRLKEAVNRNIERFPSDFIFELTTTEWTNLRTQIASSSWGGSRYQPYVFTEQGVAMLSGLLKSQRAIDVNIAIMRTLVKLRSLMDSNRELALKIEAMEDKFDEKFQVVFNAIKQLIDVESENEPITPIGFS